MTIRVLCVGDYDGHAVAHQAIEASVAIARLTLDVSLAWPGTREIGRRGEAFVEQFDAIWCVPASPYADTDAASAAIRHARERRVPFLGTCGGFQHAIIEFARHVADIRGATHEEIHPGANDLLISCLECALVEVSGEVSLRQGSRARELAGTESLVEAYHCSFALNPAYRATLQQRGLLVTGTDAAGDVRVIELDDHPFFIATLFQPERSALRGSLHPYVAGFIRAAGVVSGARKATPRPQSARSASAG